MVVWEALDALSHELELCKLDMSSRVIVFLDSDIDGDIATLLRAAVARTGAEALEVRSVRQDPATADLLADQHLLPALCERADLLITALTKTGPNLATMVETAGCRWLQLRADLAPQQYPPHANLRRRTIALRDRLNRTNTLTLSDPHGTSLVVELERSVTTCDYGIADEQLPTSSFPGGWVETIPAKSTVTGDLVVMPGDGNVSGARTISSPVRLEIRDDHVTAIEGDCPDADVIRALFEYSGQSTAYGISAITLGLNPGSRPVAPFDERLLHPHVSRLLAGIVTLSFGENLLADRPCSQTVALALPTRSVGLDGLALSIDGRLEGDFAPDVYEL